MRSAPTGACRLRPREQRGRARCYNGLRAPQPKPAPLTRHPGCLARKAARRAARPSPCPLRFERLPPCGAAGCPCFPPPRTREDVVRASKSGRGNEKSGPGRAFCRWMGEGWGCLALPTGDPVAAMSGPKGLRTGYRGGPEVGTCQGHLPGSAPQSCCCTGLPGPPPA